MPVHDDLGTRMKEFYEGVPKTRLMRRTPVAIRIDGKAFHTFTRGFKRPFDEILIKSMQETTKYLCEHIQGCVLGYTQSDEITLILVDYKHLDSSAWFDYEVQKLCSISASMATMAFNKFFYQEALEWYNKMKPTTLADEQAVVTQFQIYKQAAEKGAMFDARVFNIPREEVTNLIYWRQLDATRNSIQMVGQANFSHKELQNKSCNMIQDMLHEEKGINWNDFPTYLKRGSCVVKHQSLIDGNWRWIVDKDIPIFKGEGREYIEKLIQPEEQ
jgi:tRNA(His) 5'-end guanylyltransferase